MINRQHRVLADSPDDQRGAMMITWAAEDELLIRCCSVNMSDAAINNTCSLLKNPLNWARVVETSILHGVAPLLYCGLNQVMQAGALDHAVPPAILNELQGLYRVSKARNRHVYRVIGEIFKAFKNAGIEAMALKDVHLAKAVFPEPGLRPMGDIDILIRKEQYANVDRCMSELGFITRVDDPHFTLKYGLGHHFRRPADNMWADVQWNIMQREWDTYHEGNFDFQVENLWADATMMPVDDFEMLVPSPEHMLFHLCLHLEGHKYSELILFCEIAEFIRHYNGQLNWDDLISFTKKYKAESSVYYVLQMVQQLFDVSLPPCVLTELKPTHFKANLFEPLFGNLHTLHGSLGEIRRLAAPPVATMRKFEEAVRRQTVAAMHVYKVLDDIATTFVEGGGNPIIMSGVSSEKLIPDAALQPFGTIDLFVTRQELARMRQVLASCGFTLSDIQASEVHVKESCVGSAAPVLAHRSTRVQVQVEVCAGLTLPLQVAESLPKREIAFKAITRSVTRGGDDASKLIVRIRVVALPAEELLLHLAAKLGSQPRDRLFELCSLLEFFRGYSGPLDWQQIVTTAAQLGLSKDLSEGLLLVSKYVTQIPAEELRLLDGATRPRALESARYDPDSYGRYTNFKAAFYYLFTLISTAGATAKLRYVLSTLVGWRDRPGVPRLIYDVVKSSFGTSQRKIRTARGFAFWLDSDSVSQPANSAALKAPATHSAGEIL